MSDDRPAAGPERGRWPEGLWCERGDTLFTRSKTTLGRLIRWGETDPDERGTNGAWANHALVVVESGWVVPSQRVLAVAGKNYRWLPTSRGLAVVVEAQWRVQGGAWWAFHGKEYLAGQGVVAYRPRPRYDEEELRQFVTYACSHVGERYGWWKLGAFLAKRATGVDLTRCFFIESRPISSYLAGLANDAARPIGTPTGRGPTGGGAVVRWPGFGMPPRSADPDEMMDFCAEHPEHWEEVR